MLTNTKCVEAGVSRFTITELKVWQIEEIVTIPLNKIKSFQDKVKALETLDNKNNQQIRKLEDEKRAWQDKCIEKEDEIRKMREE